MFFGLSFPLWCFFYLFTPPHNEIASFNEAALQDSAFLYNIQVKLKPAYFSEEP
jgi:hypothetical protein